MKKLLEEILEIPDKARLCFQKNQGIKLPTIVPYLGMGASYYAPLTLFYCGKAINPQISSEYYYYLSKNIQPLGVLISQSGESSETVWNLERFREVIVITNSPDSTLGQSKKAQEVLQLYAGDEKFIAATKTYINMLLVFYLGLGINPLEGIRALENNFNQFQKKAKQQAEKIFTYIKSKQAKGFYIIGSGPNLGTAHQGALTLSETTKLVWLGASVAQYDHGLKETAQNSVVIFLNSNGKDKKRIEAVKKTLKTKSNALIIEFAETKLSEQLSPLTLIVQLNFLTNYLADYMNIKEVYQPGSKVTTVSDTIK